MIQDLIYQHHRERVASQDERAYLGWSAIGDTCDRALWYSFRKADKKDVEGRIARLFDTGHREEDRLLNELRAVGCKVESHDQKTGKQFGVSSHGGHFRGHLDAMVTGLPEFPKMRVLVDVKTINVKKYAALLKDGFKNTFPKYWAQGMGYMGHMKLEKALFLFVVKNDDTIHPEWFDFDQSEFDKYEKRAERIIFSPRPPQGISTDPSWFSCKFCNAYALCHEDKITKNVSCRTCAHSTPEQDGTWSCAHWEMTIPDLDAQLAGCDNHVLHPDLVPPTWDYEPAETGVIWLTPHGRIHNAPEGYLSSEIVANSKACAEGLREPYEQFGARVVG